MSTTVELHPTHIQSVFTITPASGPIITLWLSAGSNRHAPERKTPACGIYLDNLWKPTIASYEGLKLPKSKSPYPFAVVSWPDRSVPDDDTTIPTLMGVVESYAPRGPIEIGCYGGHGRTGTLAALIAVILGGQDALSAITSVRTRYCARAIESYIQESEIYYWAKETPPPPPAPVISAWKGGKTAQTPLPSVDDDEGWGRLMDEYFNSPGRLK